MFIRNQQEKSISRSCSKSIESNYVLHIAHCMSTSRQHAQRVFGVKEAWHEKRTTHIFGAWLYVYKVFFIGRSGCEQHMLFEHTFVVFLILWQSAVWIKQYFVSKVLKTHSWSRFSKKRSKAFRLLNTIIFSHTWYPLKPSWQIF